MKDIDKLYTLHMFEQLEIDRDSTTEVCTRLPGGWVRDLCIRERHNEAESVTSIFIPSW
jgi:hypothetical protein